MHRVPVDDQSRKEKEEVEQTARAGFSGRQVARGNLAAQPFPEVLAQLYRWRSTGALLLRRDKVKKIVFLKDGYPVLVKSNLLSECLGRVMVRERIISEADCETSIQRMKETGRQQGVLLMEMGVVTPHHLSHALQVQLEAKLYEVFGWLGGDYQFNPQADLPPSPVQLSHTPATLILEGIKRCWSSERIKQHLHGQMDLYAVPHPEPLQVLQDLTLTEREQAFAALVDGSRTLRELTAVSPLTPLQTWWLMYGMVASQMVTLARAPSNPERTVRTDMAARNAPTAHASTPPPLPPATSVSVSIPAAASQPPPLPTARVSRPTPPPAAAAETTGRAPVPPPPAHRRVPTGQTLVVAPERERIDALSRRVKEMRRQTYFEMLGVSRSAGTDEIRKAYFAQAKDFHPDKHHGATSSELKALADQVYALLSTAYETLVDPRDRGSYERGLHAARRTGLTDDVGRILQAEAAFQRGEAAARRREWAQAEADYAEAVKLYPDEGEFHCHLGWAQYQSDPAGRVEEALAQVERGLEISPRYDRGHLYAARLERAAGRLQAAEEALGRALACNPDNAEALEEMKSLRAGARGRA